MGRPKMTDEQRWTSLVERYEANVIRHESGCWAWRRRVHPEPGYPTLGTGRSGSIAAHRLSYRLHVGDPGEAWVLHRCDNKTCTRPDHLYLGDQHDNGQDIRERQTSTKERCRQGHAMTPENTYERQDSRGYRERHCRTCTRDRQGYRGVRTPRRMTDTHCGYGHELAKVGVYRTGRRAPRCKGCAAEYRARGHSSLKGSVGGSSAGSGVSGASAHRCQVEPFG